MSKESRIVKQMLKRDTRPETRTAIGTDVFIPNHSGDHSAGKVFTTPVDDYHIANKAYVDAQVVSGSGDVSKVGTPVNNELGVWTGDGTIEGAPEITYDDTSLKLKTGTTTEFIIQSTTSSEYKQTFRTVQGSTIGWYWGNESDEDAYMAISMGGGQNRFQMGTRDFNLYGANSSTPFLLIDSTTGDATFHNDVEVGGTITVTGDNASADTTYVPMVLYNTDATPPTASTVPIGTIYIQYTA